MQQVERTLAVQGVSAGLEGSGSGVRLAWRVQGQGLGWHEGLKDARL